MLAQRLLLVARASPSLARVSSPVDPSSQSTRAPRWAWRVVLVVGALALAWTTYLRSSPRSPNLPLVTSIDGPPPARAAGIIVFLHGRGSSIARASGIVEKLRQAGLPPGFAIVLVEGPFWYGLGHSWGRTSEEWTTSRARLRSRMSELLGEGGPPRTRVVIAGFSQGAGVAIDMAVEEPRIGALASLSPCFSALRGELPKRDDLRILLAHGTHDTTCPLEESSSLARVLQAAHRPVQYIEFDGEHTIPPEVVRALVALATAP